MTRRSRMGLLAITLAIAIPSMPLASGCSTGPRTRVANPDRRTSVRVGDDVVVRMPVTVTTGAEWRLASFDSAKLRMTQRLRVETDADGTRTWVARFLARLPGDSDVEYVRTAVGPDAEPNAFVGQRRRFVFRISQ